MKIVLDFDSDSNYIYIMDKNYNDYQSTKDLLAFEFTQGSKKEIRGQYFLTRMSHPLQDGKLDIIGVDIV